eukprot:TRINITY_DN1177_c0_g1_i5.p1 TRINITY_DN1177_c0_g1~~TRINITY_DN1177_c0_g1_i5.p1  ORF type:complete len:127 (+),score=49.39 TRINITY_DN1177_c0_g1_i5:119-499(+)
MLRSLVGSEMCIRDRYQRRVRGGQCEPLIGRMVEYETERTEQGFQRLKGGALLIVDPEELPEDVRKQKLAELAAFSCDMDTPEVTPVASYEGFVWSNTCLLYTSDAADEEDSVDLGGRRIIKKKKN